MKIIIYLILLINILNANYLEELVISAKKVNQEIINDRIKLITQIYKNDKEKKYLLNKYGIKDINNINDIKNRTNTININLMLAQAIIESDNGKSRFALEGNNYLGIWTFKKNIPGIIPKNRNKNDTYKVQKFDTIYDCVNRYAEILNSSIFYYDYRNLRTKTNNPLILVKGLSKYSQNKDYINIITNTLNKYFK